MVIPVVVGALSAIADKLLGWLAQILCMISKFELQKSIILKMVQVLMFLNFQGTGRASSLRITPPMVG